MPCPEFLLAPLTHVWYQPRFAFVQAAPSPNAG